MIYPPHPIPLPAGERDGVRGQKGVEDGVHPEKDRR
jgi:hypothetical protein